MRSKKRKVRIVGGGPSGLFSAILAKRRDPAAEVVVSERRRADDASGWGIAFTSRALDTLRAGDAAAAERVAERVLTWSSLDIVHRSSKVSIGGRTYHGISRFELLEALRGRCAELGVEIAFEERVAEVAKLAAKCDLLVGADGFHSAVRKAFARTFEPDLSVKPDYHRWFGTQQRFSGTTLTFREHESGIFIAHSYRTDRAASTFVVDCDVETWERADLGSRSDEETRALLEEVFARDLGGHPLISKDPRWIHFTQVRNRRWTHENVAIIGDAAHTTHFSLGVGTRLALEDALALGRALEGAPDVRTGLAAFEVRRKREVDAIQTMSDEDRLWDAGTVRPFMRLEPLDFAVHHITGGRKELDADVRKMVTGVEELPAPPAAAAPRGHPKAAGRRKRS
jgi:anthraniloyl-CoA monooxygenase